jgi:dTMP kinase
MHSQRGLLIAFDGVDSSGKATHARRLVERLRFSGQRAYLFESPDYTTSTGKKLKELLKNKNGAWDRLPWQERMQLFARNRREHRGEVVAALERGEIVVYDRYVPSSIAFFTVEAVTPQEVDHKRDQIQAEIARHEYEDNDMPREDLSIFLDVPVDITLNLLDNRKQQQGDDPEYTDQYTVQQRLYNEYDVLCQRYPEHYLRVKCVVGSQLLSIGDIAEIVWEGILTKFPQLKKP